MNQEPDDLCAAILSGDVQRRAEVVVVHRGDVLARAGEQGVSQAQEVALRDDTANDYTDEELTGLTRIVYMVTL